MTLCFQEFCTGRCSSRGREQKVSKTKKSQFKSPFSHSISDRGYLRRKQYRALKTFKMSDSSKIDIDRDRVTVLLLINSLLIKKAYNIYVTILSNQQTIKRMLHQSRQSILDQYNNLNRRLQCNLSVLAYINDQYHNKAAAQQPNRLQFPVILTAPAEMPELKLLYKRLHDLYPEAIQYLKLKIMQIKQLQLQLQQLPQQSEDFQRRQHQHSQQQAKQFQLSQQQTSMQLQLQHQGTPQVPQQPQKQQQPFSLYSMTQGQPNQQFNSPQMNMTQQRAIGAAQLNTQVAHQSKSLPNDGLSKDSSDGLFNTDEGGFSGFQDMGSTTKGGAPMLISPQQILLQQGSGNNEYNLGFF